MRTPMTVEKHNIPKIAFTAGLVYWFSTETIPAVLETTAPFLGDIVGKGMLYSAGNLFLYFASMKIGSKYAENLFQSAEVPCGKVKNWVASYAISLYSSVSRNVANLGAYISPAKYYFQLGEDYFSHRNYGIAIQYFQKIPKPEKLENPIFSNQQVRIHTMDALIQAEREWRLSENAMSHLTPDERLYGRAQNRIDQAIILKIDKDFDSESDRISFEDEQTLNRIIENNANLSFDATLLLSRLYAWSNRFSEAFVLLQPHKQKIEVFLERKLNLLDKNNLRENEKLSLSKQITQVTMTEYQPINELLLNIGKLASEHCITTKDPKYLEIVESTLNILMSCRLDEYHFIKSNFEYSKFSLLKTKILKSSIKVCFLSELFRLIALMMDSDEPASSRIRSGIEKFISHFLTYYFLDLNPDTKEEGKRIITSKIDTLLLSASPEFKLLLIAVEAHIYRSFQSTCPWIQTVKEAGENRSSRRFQLALEGYKIAIYKIRFELPSEEKLNQNSSYFLSHYRCAEIIEHLVRHDRNLSEDKKVLMIKEALQFLNFFNPEKNKSVKGNLFNSYENLVFNLKVKLNAFPLPFNQSENQEETSALNPRL